MKSAATIVALALVISTVSTCNAFLSNRSYAHLSFQPHRPSTSTIMEDMHATSLSSTGALPLVSDLLLSTHRLLADGAGSIVDCISTWLSGITSTTTAAATTTAVAATATAGGSSTGILDQLQQAVWSVPFLSHPSIPWLVNFTKSLQRIGENMFAALVVVALLQAGVALFQYRNNPSGELIVPPGLTVGVEQPSPSVETENTTTLLASVEQKESTNGMEGEAVSSAPSATVNAAATPFFAEYNDLLTAAAVYEGPQTSTSAPTMTTNSPSSTAAATDATDTAPTPSIATKLPDKAFSNQQHEQTRHARIMHRISRSLVVLIPWVANTASVLLAQYTHLFHIGCILTLTSFFDVPQTWFRRHQQMKMQEQQAQEEKPLQPAFALFGDSVFSRWAPSSSGETLSLLQDTPEKRLVVIGDSLAVGLGTVDQFDKNKNSSLPFARLENLGDGNNDNNDNQLPGPAFPRALAQTMARHWNKPVHWRSAGVDGGDVPIIRKYCLDVIREEVKQGRPPDCVVILCGANDMKSFIASPFPPQRNGPKAFRKHLAHLISDIRVLAPNTTVVVPALPTQMFHRNSPLNVFPLGIFLDTVLGFWDSQKKLVADIFPSKGVFYVGLTPGEIGHWYHPELDERVVGPKNWNQPLPMIAEEETLELTMEEWHSHDSNERNEQVGSKSLPFSPPPTITLISKDGVHPNARCYSRWGKSVASKLLVNLQTSLGR